MKKSIQEYVPLISWLVIIFATYIGKSSIAIISLFIACLFIMPYIINFKSKYSISNTSILFVLFILYYFLVTLIAMLFSGNANKMIDFILRYIILLFVVYQVVLLNSSDLVKMLQKIEYFIVVTGAYGIFENITKYNFFAKYIRVESINWAKNMNMLQSVYQPSSIYLHYSYFGVVVVCAWFISLMLPSKSKSLNIICKLILLTDIFICQSRICWISFMIGTVYYLFSRKSTVSIKALIRFSFILLIIITTFCILERKFQVTQTIVGRFSKIFVYGMQDGSTGQRIGTFTNWFQYAKTSPLEAILGTGFGSINNYLLSYSYFSGYSTADSEITVFLVESGVIGVLLICWALIITILQKNKTKIDLLANLVIVSFLVESVTLDLVANYFVLFLIMMFIILKSSNKIRLNSLEYGNEN